MLAGNAADDPLESPEGALFGSEDMEFDNFITWWRKTEISIESNKLSHR